MKVLFSIEDVDLEIIYSKKEILFYAINDIHTELLAFASANVADPLKTCYFFEKASKMMIANPAKLSNHKTIASMAKKAANRGLNETIFRKLAYKVVWLLLAKLPHKECAMLEVPVKKLFGHHIGFFEKEIFTYNNQRRQQAVSTYDKETFSIYNEALSHRVANVTNKIISHTDTLHALAKAGRIERVIEIGREKEKEYHQNARDLRDLVLQVRRVSEQGKGLSAKWIGHKDLDFIFTVIKDHIFEEAVVFSVLPEEECLVQCDELSFLRAIFPVAKNALEHGATEITLACNYIYGADEIILTVSNNGAPIENPKCALSEFSGTKKKQFGYGLNYAAMFAKSLSLKCNNPPMINITFPATLP